ncbi:hypothetical protein PoB_006094700 [Plakobranchus ocellatus]|uniref:Uncharacterized protein n=1 Tax=Plakobranchus ocellatus TaxID=259542 RepID=A0AAV4CRC2_9GAST|nr:hypothetical protein PoB_006094700 [Plakobranchus ocellatus]
MQTEPDVIILLSAICDIGKTEASGKPSPHSQGKILRLSSRAETICPTVRLSGAGHVCQNIDVSNRSLHLRDYAVCVHVTGLARRYLRSDTYAHTRPTREEQTNMEWV